MNPSRPQKSKYQKRKGNRKKLVLIAGFLVVLAAVIITGSNMDGKEGSNENGSSMVTVLIRTNKGNILIELREDRPITVGNFKNLVQEGFYDGTIFHRVIDGFMIQGGDPTGTGYGDPSIPTIQDEFTGYNANIRGTIAMANAGPNTGSSQFFINLVDNNYLNAQHPVFGRVIEGMDIVDQIAKVDTDPENNRPLQEVRIIEAQLVD